MNVAAGAWVCLLSPLVAALAITLGGTRVPRRVAAYLATAATGVSFVAAIVAFLGTRDSGEKTVSVAYDWLSTTQFPIKLSLYIDQLSLVMMLVVSGVGTLIVAYAVDYMDGSDEERRFFAYMSLFVFSMLLLVESGNLVILLAGWGLVGLCSYLLIGYHQEKPSAMAAAKKAFIMNAVGDATMALALFLLIFQIGSLDFERVLTGADGIAGGWTINLIALGLLGGALAKSAQIPLHTWLPDAMEGPTPVSALIHAATMVTAGVYLIVRMHPLFEAAPHVQEVAAGLGAVTLLAAGLIALVQTDIKRVIAYSTMSQIGYMFLAAGIGAYSAAIFHLMTHAFFKALLFLGAGVVSHAIGGEQDMRKMGGLRSRLPHTYISMLIGAAALAGIPPLAGFFSKDAILAAALSGGAYERVLLVVGLVGAFLTGLYAFRMIFLVFWGEPSAHVEEHFHLHGEKEAPSLMRWVVASLTGLTLIGGLLQIAGLWELLFDWLEPVAEPLLEPTHAQDWLTSGIALAIAGAGIFVAWGLFVGKRWQVPSAPKALVEKLYFDRLYDAVFYRPAVAVATGFRNFVEGPVIDGSADAVGATARTGGRILSIAQTGALRVYALAIASGVSLLALLFLVLR